MPFVVFGTFILWLGWYGYNGGSTNAFTGESVDIAANIIVVNTMAAATCGMTVFLVHFVKEHFGSYNK